MSRRSLFRLAKKMRYCRPGLPRFPHPLPIQLAHVAHWFHAASDTTRLAILELLSQRERCVSEIAEFLDASLSTVSFHLRVLRDAGLVADRREGRWSYYRIVPEALAEVHDLAVDLQPARGVLPIARKGACCG